ncbi:hypothetical protein [Chitinophaga sp. XS-30]|uniref:hypothetical protein n=1 Tax=Chitinophaga sp. XS-30 TaxID=2604421 RepID=UPI001FEFE5F2|nr:hypothetical protein [Chitinophaga sp. XS-30]
MQTHKERYLWLLSRKLSGEILDEEKQELDALTRGNPQLRKEGEALQVFWGHGDGHPDENETRTAFDKLKGRMEAMDTSLWPVQETGVRRVKLVDTHGPHGGGFDLFCGNLLYPGSNGPAAGTGRRAPENTISAAPVPISNWRMVPPYG